MMNYSLTSIFIHLAILLGLYYTPEVNTSGASKISVNIIEKTKSRKLDQKPLILPTRAKPLIPGPGASKAEKYEKVDMTDYANQLKVVVDPVWIANIEPIRNHLSRTYQIIVLLFPNKYGKIISIRIVKASGNKTLDDLAIKTFKEVGQLPKPPESLVKEGIEWDLTISGRNQ